MVEVVVAVSVVLLAVVMVGMEVAVVVSIELYIISSVMHAFWLVLTYDLLEDRRIDEVIIKTFFHKF